jgi:F0F1-type ATP synthase alpha subunit
MAAAAAGERVRDEGGHSLVVLDDLSPLSSECV